MWRLATFAGLAGAFIFVIALPNLLAVGLVALVTAPDLFPEGAAAVGAYQL